MPTIRFRAKLTAIGSQTILRLPEAASRKLPSRGMSMVHAAGLTEVIVPERNGPDLDDVPSDMRDHMRFHLVGSVDQVLALALDDKDLALAA
jgi:Lon protease (S16) C-terminal proteolytic domain